MQMLNADTLYSVLLVLAIATAAGAAVLGALRFFAVEAPIATRIHILPLLLGAALVSGLASAIVHAMMGHGANSSEPMTSGRFIGEHPAFFLVAGLLLVGMVAWTTHRARD